MRPRSVSNILRRIGLTADRSFTYWWYPDAPATFLSARPYPAINPTQRESFTSRQFHPLPTTPVAPAAAKAETAETEAERYARASIAVSAIRGIAAIVRVRWAVVAVIW